MAASSEDSRERHAWAYDLIQQQGQFYQSALEQHRVYVLQQIDSVKVLIAQGVGKEELRERLDALRRNVEADINRVERNVTDVSSNLDRVEHNILQQIHTVAGRQSELQNAMEDRQRQGLKRVVTIQATILTFILTTSIALVLNFIFHFIGLK